MSLQNSCHRKNLKVSNANPKMMIKENTLYDSEVKNNVSL